MKGDYLTTARKSIVFSRSVTSSIGRLWPILWPVVSPAPEQCKKPSEHSRSPFHLCARAAARSALAWGREGDRAAKAAQCSGAAAIAKLITHNLIEG